MRHILQPLKLLIFGLCLGGPRLTNLNGDNITSGTVSESRLGLSGMGYSGRIDSLPPSSQGQVRFGAASGFTTAVLTDGSVVSLSPHRSCMAMNLSVMLVLSDGVPTPPETTIRGGLI